MTVLSKLVQARRGGCLEYRPRVASRSPKPHAKTRPHLQQVDALRVQHPLAVLLVAAAVGLRGGVRRLAQEDLADAGDALVFVRRRSVGARLGVD
jgi:hypothetical protein